MSLSWAPVSDPNEQEAIKELIGDMEWVLGSLNALITSRGEEPSEPSTVAGKKRVSAGGGGRGSKKRKIADADK
jgi:hypothetical protein